MRLKLWNTNPMFALRMRARRLSQYPDTSSPRKRYVPSVGLSIRPRMCSKVDFPHPEGPMTETNSPSLRVKLM